MVSLQALLCWMVLPLWLGCMVACQPGKPTVLLASKARLPHGQEWNIAALI
jgi:hypothetical protein